MQFAVILPLLMLLTLGIIQTGMWLHGRNVAHRTAVAATDIARGSYGSATEARLHAEKLAQSGGLTSVSVDVSVSADEVRASISARAPGILDIGLPRLHETAAAPRERVTQP